MCKPTPARDRTANWSGGPAALFRCLSLPVWLDKAMSWLSPRDGSPGRPGVFSDAAIPFCLCIKGLFKLPLRQTTGMVASLQKVANLDRAVPDDTTLQGAAGPRPMREPVALNPKGNGDIMPLGRAAQQRRARSDPGADPDHAR